MELSAKEFMQLQPGYPQVGDTDKYYYVIAVHMARAWDKSGVLVNIDERVRTRVVLTLIGYYQDIVADAGLWRTFTSLHQEQFGQPLPHYGRSDDYIDYELNLDDLRYLIWYTLDYSIDGAPSPHDDVVSELAQVFLEVLDYDYEHAPVPVELTMLTGVDVNDENDRALAYELAYWFYWRSFLMQGNAAAATSEAMGEARAIIEKCEGGDPSPLLNDMNDRIMATRPATIGPISLPLAQWLKKITE